MLSKVNGVFRLSQDVELRYLNNGSALAKLNLVNSSKYKTATGEQKEDTCFIEGVVFGKLGEVANTYLKKGSKVYIDAELKQDTWQNNEGQNRSKYTLKINTFEMLDSKSDTQGQQAPTQRQEPKVVYEQQSYNPSDDIDDSSIPF